MGSDNNCCSNNRVYQEEQDSEIITDGNNSEIHKCKENKKVKKFIPSQKILDDTSSYSSHSYRLQMQQPLYLPSGEIL